jgi:hypothetical protein
MVLGFGLGIWGGSVRMARDFKRVGELYVVFFWRSYMCQVIKKAPNERQRGRLHFNWALTHIYL